MPPAGDDGEASVRSGKLGQVNDTAFGRTLLITGSDELLGDRAVAARRRHALSERPDAQVNELRADQLESTMLSEMLGGSLFASDIVAIIDDLGSCPPGAVDQVLAAAVAPGPELCLILRHRGGMKGKGLLDKLKKAKVPVEAVAAPKTWELPKFVMAEARQQKIRLTPEAAAALVAAVGSDLRALVGAVAQLASDATSAEVDEAMMKRYFSGRAEVTSFAVADAVLAGHTSLAVERLRWALNTGAAPVLVTSALAASLRGMGKFLDAEAEGIPPGEMARHVGVPPWKLKDYARHARLWGSGGIANAIALVARTDADVKGAAVDANYALEAMVLAVLSQRRR